MTPAIISDTPPAQDDSGWADILIIGGGAAGLATAIFATRAVRASGGDRRVVVVDGARTLGAKILVSGGSRCNVTNAEVGAADFWRGGSPFVRQVLRALPVKETVGFFEEIGVRLHEEPLGKLFPTTNKARSVLDALLHEASRLKIEIRTSCRVLALAPVGNGWRLETSNGPLRSRRIVLATGGLSLPKTGSDGAGYAFAKSAGHSIVSTVPALEPLILGGEFHSPLSGVSHEASIRVKVSNEKAVTISGSLLWTHFGISGPLALDASRFFRRAKADGDDAEMTLNLVAALRSESLDAEIITATKNRPNTHVRTELNRALDLPHAVTDRVVQTAIGEDRPLARVTREERRALVSALTALPLDIRDGRGYNFAEVTSGGVRLEEVDPKTMESRIAPGLYFVGEILDVDGRIGGFNFQWAWSTAKVAGRALAR